MHFLRRWLTDTVDAEPGAGRRFTLHFAVLNLGLALFALGLALGYRAGLGLNSWGIFQAALTRYVPLTFGQMSIAIGAAMIGVSWWAGIRPGIGTVCNMLLVGVWFDVFAALLPQVSDLRIGVPMMLAGVLVLGWASGVYIKAGLGAGPRDSFMLAIVRRTGWRVGVARGVIEGTVFALGVLMDRSQVGIGTVAFTFAIGPVVEWAFRVLRVAPNGQQRAASSERQHPRKPDVRGTLLAKCGVARRSLLPKEANMGRAIWITVKFVAGVAVGAVLGATAAAYASGAGDPTPTASVSLTSRVRGGGTNFLAGVRTRVDDARTAGDLAAQEIEAAMTQQFRTKVADPDALNPPNALHP